MKKNENAPDCRSNASACGFSATDRQRPIAAALLTAEPELAQYFPATAIEARARQFARSMLDDARCQPWRDLE